MPHVVIIRGVDAVSIVLWDRYVFVEAVKTSANPLLFPYILGHISLHKRPVNRAVSKVTLHVDRALIANRVRGLKQVLDVIAVYWGSLCESLFVDVGATVFG